MTAELGHLDEHGERCTRHPASLDALLTFATIGARVASFNHDLASKLQGLMMALDELDELAGPAATADFRRALHTAQTALDEAKSVLSANRSLTRTTTTSSTALRDLVNAAGERAGVAVRGDLPDGELHIVGALTAHGLGLALDALAGSGRGRGVDVAATRTGDKVELVFTSSAPPAPTLGDALALAAFVVARAGGELRCCAGGIRVQLPVS